MKTICDISCEMNKITNTGYICRTGNYKPVVKGVLDLTSGEIDSACSGHSCTIGVRRDTLDHRRIFQVVLDESAINIV